jgi:carotenoid cleavage dioxygenase
VFDEVSAASDLVILDASAPGSQPVARIHLPQRVPYGFHGSWIADSALQRS